MTSLSGFRTFHALKKEECAAAVNGFLPRTLVVPLKQEAGCRCACLVREGDSVREGQLIAAPPDGAGGQFRAGIHAPAPGTVSSVGLCVCPDGRRERAVTISLAGTFSFLGRRRKEIDWSCDTSAALTRRIAASGVLNTFRTPKPVSLAEQISAAGKNRTRILAVRLFDEDPSRITDSVLTALYRDEIMEGAEIAARALDADGVVFLTERDFQAPEAQDGRSVPVRFVPADTHLYPCGFRKEICAAVRKSVRDGPFPNIGAGDVFTDASTMLEVCRTVKYGMPVVDRFVHVSGGCVPASGLLNVRIGTTLHSLARQCGGFIRRPAAVIVNGLVTGFSAGSLEAPVTKYVKSVQFLPAARSPDQRPSDCVLCGNCRRVCPRGLSPDILCRHISGGRPAPAEYVESAALCSHCGLCNAVCPSRIPVSQIIEEFKRRNGGVYVSEE